KFHREVGPFSRAVSFAPLADFAAKDNPGRRNHFVPCGGLEPHAEALRSWLHLQFQERFANPRLTTRGGPRRAHHAASLALRRWFARMASCEHAGLLVGCSHTSNALATPNLVKANLL